MIHKEFIQNLAGNLNLSKAKTSHYSRILIDILRKNMEKEELDIENFGKFVRNEKNKINLQPDDNLIKEINLK